MGEPKRDRLLRLRRSLKKLRHLKGSTARRKWVEKLSPSDIQTLCTCVRRVLRKPKKFLTPQTRKTLRKQENLLLKLAEKGKSNEKSRQLDEALHQKGAGFVACKYLTL